MDFCGNFLLSLCAPSVTSVALYILQGTCEFCIYPLTSFMEGGHAARQQLDRKGGSPVESGIVLVEGNSQVTQPSKKTLSSALEVVCIPGIASIPLCCVKVPAEPSYCSVHPTFLLPAPLFCTVCTCSSLFMDPLHPFFLTTPPWVDVVLPRVPRCKVPSPIGPFHSLWRKGR